MNMKNRPPIQEPPAPATYGVKGMTEFLAMIPAGAVALPLHFTGGTLSGYGIRPATATVTDPLFCKYIEESPDFKSGKIVKLSTRI